MRFTFIGWVGAAFLLGAYLLADKVFLNQGFFIEWGSIPFQVMNALGALMLMADALYRRAYPPAFIMFCWCSIALYSLAEVFFPSLVSYT